MSDTIQQLASKEAGRIRKFRDVEEEGEDRSDRDLPAVPLLHISREPYQKRTWRVRASGHTSHPNEGRMQFICNWITSDVLNDEPQGDPSGTYRMELHDSCTYLPRANEYRDVLSFCRGSLSQSVAMFPDPYQAAGSTSPVSDRIPWASKRSKVLFAGSTTGSREPETNARIDACLWSLDHPLETDFRITSIVQMSPFEAHRRIPRMPQILAPVVSLDVHHHHRFIMNIVGNTACWSRVPMVMRSGSVLLHMPHDDMTWYQPLMTSGKHYVECVTHDQILERRETLLHDPSLCASITSAANAFHDGYMTRQAASCYARRLLFDIRGM